MIDFSLEIKKVQPINIKEMEFNRHKIDANIKKSIILYNISVGEIKKCNLDLAINDLKKALSYNGSFSEAIRLMGLCYVNGEEYKKAEKTFKKLAKYPIYSELANEYIQSLIIKKSMSKNTDSVDEVKYDSSNKGKKFAGANSSKIKIIIWLSIFIIVTAGAIVNHFYPLYVQDAVEKFQVISKVAVYKKEIEEEKEKNPNEDESLPEENTIAYEDYKVIEKNLQDTKSELDSYKSKYNVLTNLNEAEQCFINGEYEKTASILINMRSMNFDDETKVRFDKLWQGLKQNALWNIYNNGNMLYKQGKYAEALPKLKIASEIDPNLYLMPWINYQIGTCYKETNDNVNALTYFKKVRDNYPESQYTPNAKMIIKQIEN